MVSNTFGLNPVRPVDIERDIYGCPLHLRQGRHNANSRLKGASSEYKDSQPYGS
jgi:hypothetical protein